MASMSANGADFVAQQLLHFLGATSRETETIPRGSHQEDYRGRDWQSVGGAYRGGPRGHVGLGRESLPVTNGTSPKGSAATDIRPPWKRMRLGGRKAHEASRSRESGRQWECQCCCYGL